MKQESKEVNDTTEVRTNNKRTLVTLFVIFVCVFIFNLRYSFILVSGDSMLPTYHNNQMLLADKKAEIKRFDCVIIRTDEKFIIKRIIGLPGEIIEYKNNQLFINGEQYVDYNANGHTVDFQTSILSDNYYCLGDNRENSLDSRYYGTFSRDRIIAKIKEGDK